MRQDRPEPAPSPSAEVRATRVVRFDVQIPRLASTHVRPRASWDERGAPRPARRDPDATHRQTGRAQRHGTGTPARWEDRRVPRVLGWHCHCPAARSPAGAGDHLIPRGAGFGVGQAPNCQPDRRDRALPAGHSPCGCSSSSAAPAPRGRPRRPPLLVDPQPPPVEVDPVDGQAEQLTLTQPRPRRPQNRRPDMAGWWYGRRLRGTHAARVSLRAWASLTRSRARCGSATSVRAGMTAASSRERAAVEGCQPGAGGRAPGPRSPHPSAYVRSRDPPG